MSGHVGRTQNLTASPLTCLPSYLQSRGFGGLSELISSRWRGSGHPSGLRVPGNLPGPVKHPRFMVPCLLLHMVSEAMHPAPTWKPSPQLDSCTLWSALPLLRADSLRICYRHSFLLKPARKSGGAVRTELWNSNCPRWAAAPKCQARRRGSPPHCCLQPVGGRVPLVTGGLAFATGAMAGKYSTATHQLRGPRRPTWWGRWAASWPPACRDTQSPPQPSPTRPGLGLLCVQPLGSVLPQPAWPPPHVGLGR